MITWEKIILCDNPECRKEISRAPVRDQDVQDEMNARKRTTYPQQSSTLCAECLRAL